MRISAIPDGVGVVPTILSFDSYEILQDYLTVLNIYKNFVISIYNQVWFDLR